MNGSEQSNYMVEEGFAQIPEESAPPFGAGIGGQVGGEFNIDGTPMRLVTIIIAAGLLVVLYHYADFRWHVTI
jgi:hypothetical protein